MSNTYFSQLSAAKRVYCVIFILLISSLIVSTTSQAKASNVPKSGQTTLYATGDDGDLQKGVSWPSPRFTDNGDGTVTDNLTNLTWLKDANCYGAKAWIDALTDASNLGHGSCSLSDSSFDVWRLPTIKELESLIHLGVSDPAVPSITGTGKASASDPFDSLQSGEYWSSTTDTSQTSSALAVNMQWGQTESKAKSSTDVYSLFVRDSVAGTPAAEVQATGQTLCYNATGTTITCTDTGQDGDLQKGTVWPSPRFTDNNNGTVLDNLTGLTWLKNADCAGLSGWSGALSQANLLASGSCGLNDNSSAGDWRLPNRKELLSLISFGFSSPALSDTDGTGQWSNSNPFTNVQPTSGYWSGTTFDGKTTHSWFVSLNTGIMNIESKTNIAYVWPVRDNLPTILTVAIAGDGTGTVTSSPAGINCPGTCSSTFTENTTVTLQASADSGSRFDGWSIGSCGKNPICKMTITSAQNITATFVESSATVSSWMILLSD